MANAGFYVTLRPSASSQIETLGDEAASAFADRTLANAQRTVAIRTGRLRRELRKIKVRRGVYLVGSDTPYTRFVELGTSRMAAQPFLRPALNQAKGGGL